MVEGVNVLMLHIVVESERISMDESDFVRVIETSMGIFKDGCMGKEDIVKVLLSTIMTFDEDSVESWCNEHLCNVCSNCKTKW